MQRVAGKNRYPIDVVKIPMAVPLTTAFKQNIERIGPQALKAVYDVARKAAMDVVTGQMRDGGLFSGGGR